MLGSVKRRAVIQEITRRLLNTDSAKLVLRLRAGTPTKQAERSARICDRYTRTGWVTSTRDKPALTGNQMRVDARIPIQASVNRRGFSI